MADLIKKIKIKKQDGTFTDYIPIGAEAKNISTKDGESVQEKIDKVIYKEDIVDNLESNNNEKALSAKQGKILNSSYLIDEITYEKFYHENSKSYVHVLHIPHLDKDGKTIEIKHGFAKDNIDTGAERAIDFNDNHNATLTINASVWAIESQVTEQIKLEDLLGLYIHEGEILKDNRSLLSEDFLKNRYILGITETGLLKSYIGDTPVQTILNDGVIETCQAFIPILINGQNNRQNLINAGTTYWAESTFTQTQDNSPKYNKIYYILENNVYKGVMNLNAFEAGVTYYEETSGFRYPRQIIAQNSQTLDYYIITGEGKGTTSNLGLTLYEYTTIAQKYGCDFAFVLDGGGSTATIYKNIMVNNKTDNPSKYHAHTDGLGYKERKVSDFLYFSKDKKVQNDNNISFLLSEIEKLNEKVNKIMLTEEDRFFNPTNFYENANQHHIFNFNKWNEENSKYEPSMRIYFDNIAFPGGLNIEDVTNNIPHLLRIYNNTSDGIRYLENKLGLLYDQIQAFANNTDLNNLPNMFTIGRGNINQNITPMPIEEGEDGFNFVILQFGWDTCKFQFAFVLAQACIVKMRTYTTSWGPWKKFALETDNKN